WHAGRFPQSLAVHTELLEIFKKTLGSDSPEAGNMMWAVARDHHKAGKLEEAERLWRQSLKILKIHREKGAPVTPAFGLLWISRNQLLQKKYTAAEESAREALAIFEKESSELWHCYVAMGLVGSALLGQQKYDEAEKYLLPAYEGLK